MKAKVIMSIVLTLILVGLGFGTYFYLNQDKEPNGGNPADGDKPSYSYMNTLTSSQDYMDKVGVKIIDEDSAIVIANNSAIICTYTKEGNNYTLNGSLYIDEGTSEVHTFNFVEETSTATLTEISNNSPGQLLGQAESGSDKLLAQTVSLSKTEDIVFETGLWKLKKRRNESGQYKDCGEDGFIYNIDHKTYFTSDESQHAAKMDLYIIANVVYYIDYDYKNNAREDKQLLHFEKETNLPEEIKGLGDMLCQYEDEEIYYYAKVKDSECKLQITEDMKLSNYNCTFRSYTYSKETYYITNEEEVDMTDLVVELNIKNDGNCSIILKKDGETTDLSCNGKWYNLSTGILVVLENKSLYGGYFAIGEDEGESFPTNSITRVDYDEETETEVTSNRYTIVWEA